ncbi:LysR family transcriptional regulator [Paraliobacillus zengyii]|uniref:LysR family transcriptional regulator n=1 Tax=Paraliobacillus zengyii TaxID=2213194 RepID=UPI000DD370C6|nr:LysR family transcriptional regulator [Paraliobacillus zengyii]
MDFEQLRTYVSLTNSKNFTRTADEMNVVQSTVTARIKLLEEEVGKKLFIRKTRNLELTDAGKTFLSYAKQTLEIMNEAIKATRIKSNYNSSLVIGGLNSLWDTPIFDHINNYQSIYSNTAIRLITGHSKDIIEKIQYGLIDVGFVYNPPYSSFFNVYNIREESISLVGSTKLVAKLNTLTSDFVSDIPFIHYNWGSDFSEWFEEEIGRNETMRYRVDHTGVALRLILKGEGIGFMLNSIIDKYEKEGLISSVLYKPKIEIPKRKIYMICSKKKKEKVNVFWQNMIDENSD